MPKKRKNKKTKKGAMLLSPVHIVALAVILIGGVFVGSQLKNQRPNVSASEKEVAILKMNQVIEKRNSMLDSDIKAVFDIRISEHPEHGPILTDNNGLSLYVFLNDEMGISHCYDQCVINWPPLQANGSLMAGVGIMGNIGKILRNDGINQVTYNGAPLYYWVNDQKPGDITGHGVNEVWKVAKP